MNAIFNNFTAMDLTKMKANNSGLSFEIRDSLEVRRKQNEVEKYEQQRKEKLCYEH